MQLDRLLQYVFKAMGVEGLVARRHLPQNLTRTRAKKRQAGRHQHSRSHRNPHESNTFCTTAAARWCTENNQAKCFYIQHHCLGRQPH